MAIVYWTQADLDEVAERIHNDTSLDPDAKRRKAKEWAKGLAAADSLFNRKERARFIKAALGKSKR